VTGVAPANASTVRVVLSFQQGSQLSAGAAWFDELRLQVVQPVTCDSIDFNNDGLFPDDADLVDFLAVLGGAACSTTSCNSIDFNNDNLFPDDADLLAFLRVLAGGACEE
jgi:hypothetical protein